MQVTVDREHMKFTHKHPDTNVLANLLWIEYPRRDLDTELWTFPLDDASGFWTFTDMELKILYRNTTGFDHTGTSHLGLLQTMYDLAIRLPVTDVNPFELETAAASINDENVFSYQYIKGKALPVKLNDLYDVPALQAPQDLDEESRANAAKIPPAVAAGVKQKSKAGHTAPVQATTTKAPPKRGSVSATIWDTADKMWEEAGSPKDKAKVTALRKEMKQVLLGEGINATTIGCQLVRWHKKRAEF